MSPRLFAGISGGDFRTTLVTAASHSCCRGHVECFIRRAATTCR